MPKKALQRYGLLFNPQRKSEKMREKKKFLVGSRAFFGKYADFQSKDTDYLYIMEGWDFKDKSTKTIKKDGMDLFFMRDVPKEILLREELSSNQAIKTGKYLVPEFAEFLGLTLDDLEELRPLFVKLDEKHYYQKLIFNSYIKNGSFTLTDEQRDCAYREYRKARNL